MNFYKQHQRLIQEFKLECTNLIPNLFLFDRNVGLFYTKNGSPISISIKGQADVYGLLNSNGKLIHIELEFKTGEATQTKEQKNWEKFITKNNGIYMLVRSKNDVQNLITLLKEKGL